MDLTVVTSGWLDRRDASADADVKPASAGVVALFTSTLFVSAFLLFLVQPMIAKMVLPLLGGSPMVWNTCMVFFQIALLAGYTYAHLASTWCSARAQVALHGVLLLLPFAVLPFVVHRDVVPPEGAPVAWLLLFLTVTIGGPFFVLSTTASTFQRWFSRTNHPSALDPYFLYAASNMGSFAALIAYPAVVEPLLSLPNQGRLWTAGYAVFALLAAACAIVAWRGHEAAPAGPDGAANAGAAVAVLPSSKQRARWVALAFVPSSLLLAITTYVSTDIAAVPLLWVVPLGLYLLTFVAAFSARANRLRRPASVMFPLVLVPLALVMCTGTMLPSALMLAAHVLAFVTAAFICHAELADGRPSPAHLTEFYFWISLGGMLGGLFNALAAPALFKSVAEYPIVLVLACFMMPARGDRAASAGDRLFDIGVPLAVGGCALAAARLFDGAAGLPWLLPAFSVPAVMAFSQRRRPLRFGLSMGALLLAGMMFVHAGQTLYAERTFFGLYRVQRDGSGKYIALAHGTTLHGMQAVSGADRMEPLTYYHRLGPFGQAFDAFSRVSRVERAAVIGLGVGSLAAYAEPPQRWTFYEIDPAVERIARDTKYFTFLQHCGDTCRVVLGDARLSLAHNPDGQYDLLTLDAFSSDAIPVHLLTSEALSIYLTRLGPHGKMLFHISNAHLELAPIVARLAEEHSLVAMAQVDQRQPDWPVSRAPSSWVAMARQKEDLGSLMTDARWTPLRSSAGTPLWTDDFSNILSVVQFR